MNNMFNTAFFLSYLLLLAVMFILPFYTAAGYSIMNNTTSQLGAQLTPNAWVMNLTFVLIGLTSICAGWPHYEGYWIQKSMLLIFGISLVLVAFFSHAPIDTSLNYNVQEDKLHSLFASATGFSFTILAISTGFIKVHKTEMLLPIMIGIVATLLSLLMFKLENFAGIWQRLIFILSFGWMAYEFRK